MFYIAERFSELKIPRLFLFQEVDVYKRQPKGRYVQIGILERGKAGTRSRLQAMRCWIGKRIAYNNPLSS